MKTNKNLLIGIAIILLMVVYPLCFSYSKVPFNFLSVAGVISIAIGAFLLGFIKGVQK